MVSEGVDVTSAEDTGTQYSSAQKEEQVYAGSTCRGRGRFAPARPAMLACPVSADLQGDTPPTPSPREQNVPV